MPQPASSARPARSAPLFAPPKLRHPRPGMALRDPLGRNRAAFEPQEIPPAGLDAALEAARSDWRGGASLASLFGADTPFGIHGSVGRSGQNRPGDVFKLQALLHRLGYRDASATDGPTGFLGSFDHEPLMAFQRDHGLREDGHLEPGGETARALAQYARADHPAASGPANAADGGIVQVRAHERSGHPVRAHTRGSPGGGEAAPPRPMRRKSWSDAPLPPMQSPVPNPTIRTDRAGDGNVGASRRRATHNDEHYGVDLDVRPGEVVGSPVDGVVIGPADPYASNPQRRGKLNGIRIRAENGDEVIIYYISPNQSLQRGTPIRRGDPIGTAQDVREVHGPEMDPHIHIEVKTPSGAYKDPTAAIGARRRPQGAPPQR